MSARHLHLLLMLGLVVLLALPARAHHAEIHLGILAHRPIAQERADWLPVLEALQQRLPDIRLQAQFLDYAAIDAAVLARRLDALITSPGHYVALRHSAGIGAPLATLLRRHQGIESAAFGGVVVVRSDHALRRWQDLRGKRVAYVHDESLGGFQMQRYELQRRGLFDHDIHWLALGLPHDQVLQAVAQGRADAGFVRDGVLEAMERNGQLLPDQLTVLQPQDLPGYPLQVSTPLYPEWPVLTLPTVDTETRRRLTLALLDVRADPRLAQRSIAGFVPPHSYAEVERILRELRARPFGVPQLTPVELLQQYRTVIVTAGAALILLVGMLWLIERQRRALSLSLAEKARLLDELSITAATFDSSQGVLITDARGLIERVNPAFTDITGYTQSEAAGHTPGQLLRSDRQDARFYRDMWAQLTQSGRWSGEIWNRRKNGEIYPEWLTITAIYDAHGQLLRYVAIFSDLSWKKKAEAEIESLAFFDPLTGLPNRRLVLDRIEQAIREARRASRWGAVLFIDLDHFKLINDTQGHDIGDAVLRTVAQRIRLTLREQDTPARLGGDEFLVLLPAEHLQRDEAALAAQTVADKLASALRRPLDSTSEVLTLTLSIGIAIYGDGADVRNAADLLKSADLAMYSVKQHGRNGVAFFDTEMEAAVRQRHRLQQDLARAIEAGHLRLYLQPQVNRSGRIVGAEVLLRWPKPAGGFIPPSEFIALAEETGLILPLGDWVLRQTCALLQRWQAVPALAPLRLAINVSAREFREPDFASRVARQLSACALPPAQLELELTESVLLDEMDAARTVLEQLRTTGVSLALDDFGTGYSSLAYLTALPFDTIKLDQRFVAKLDHPSQQEAAVVSAILALTHALGMRLLAEGVETERQADYLKQHGCDLLQGYLYGRPMPTETFESLVCAQTTTSDPRDGEPKNPETVVPG